MDPSRPRNSTRAAKAHPRILKPRRKPAALQTPKIRTAAAEQFHISPTQAVREMRDGVPATALRQVQAHLERICSTAIVVAHALREQNVQLDDDAACVLRWHVSDHLFEQIQRLKRIIAGGAP